MFSLYISRYDIVTWKQEINYQLGTSYLFLEFYGENFCAQIDETIDEAIDGVSRLRPGKLLFFSACETRLIMIVNLFGVNS